MTSRARVLLVEDDAGVSTAMTEVLTVRGYRVTTERTGRGGLSTAAEQRPDVVLLDLGLPDLDGFDVLTRLRAVSDVPVIVVSARGASRDVQRALSAGANDYLVKPFGLDDLIIRIEQTQRERMAAEQRTDQVYDDGLLRLDSANREVRVGGEPVALSAIEFALLEVLVWHAGTAQTLATLVEKAWGDDTENAAARMKFTMYRLRKKLGSAPIVAVRGVGYLYRPPGRPLVDDRVARDLHDLVIQRLFTVGMGLQQLAGDVDPAAGDQLRSYRDILDEAIREIRETIATGPAAPAPDLTSQVFAACRESATALGFEPEVTITGPIDELVPAAVGADLMAVLREALSNVAKHARASRVRVRIRASTHVGVAQTRLSVVDDGAGLPARPHQGHGLDNMAARAKRWGGGFRATTERGTTRIEWGVPWSDVDTGTD
jgi:DNA-binding response OmpR family regulator